MKILPSLKFLTLLVTFFLFLTPLLGQEGTNKSKALEVIRPLLQGSLNELCLAQLADSSNESITEFRQQLLEDVKDQDFFTAFRRLNSGIRDLPSEKIEVNDLTTAVLFLMKMNSRGSLSANQVRYGKAVSKFLINEPANSNAAVYGFKFLSSMAYQEGDLNEFLSIAKKASERLTGNQQLVRSTLVELNQKTGLLFHQNGMLDLAMKSYLSNKDSEWTLLKLESIWRGYHLACKMDRFEDAQLLLDLVESCPENLQASPYYRQSSRLAKLSPSELSNYRNLAKTDYLPVAMKCLNMQEPPYFQIAPTLPPANELSKQGVIQLMFQAGYDPYAFRKLSMLGDTPPVFVKRSVFYKLFVDFGSQISISDQFFKMPIIFAKGYSAMQLNNLKAAKQSYDEIYEILENGAIPNHRLELLDQLGLYLASKDESMVDISVNRLVPSLEKRIAYPSRNQKVKTLVNLMNQDAKWHPKLKDFLEAELAYHEPRDSDPAFISALKQIKAKREEAQRDYSDSSSGIANWLNEFQPGWWPQVPQNEEALSDYLKKSARSARLQNDGSYPVSTFYNFINRASKTTTYTERLKAVLLYANSDSGVAKEKVSAFSAAVSSIAEYAKPNGRADLVRSIETIPHVSIVGRAELGLVEDVEMSTELGPEETRSQLNRLISDSLSNQDFAQITTILKAGDKNLNTANICINAISKLRSVPTLTEVNRSQLDRIESSLKFKVGYYQPIIDSVLAVFAEVPPLVKRDGLTPKQLVAAQRNNRMVAILQRFKNGSLMDFQTHSPVEVLEQLKENSPIDKRVEIATVALDVIQNQFMWMQGWQSAINFDSRQERELIKKIVDQKRLQGDRSKAERTLAAINAQLDFDSGRTPDWEALDFSVLIDRNISLLEAKLSHYMELKDRPSISSTLNKSKSTKLAEIKNRPISLYCWKALGNTAAQERTVGSMRDRIKALLIDEAAGFDRNSPLVEASEMMAALHNFGTDLVTESLLAQVQAQNPWSKGRAEFLIAYYLGAKQYQNAIELAEQGVELFDSPFFITHLAIAQHFSGDRQEAKLTARKYLDNHGHGHWQYHTMNALAGGEN